MCHGISISVAAVCFSKKASNLDSMAVTVDALAQLR